MLSWVQCLKLWEQSNGSWEIIPLKLLSLESTRRGSEQLTDLGSSEYVHKFYFYSVGRQRS